MSDIKLFRLVKGQAAELHGDASDLEKPLQTLIENKRSMAYTHINSEDRLVQATFGPAGTLGRRSTASAAALARSGKRGY